MRFAAQWMTGFALLILLAPTAARAQEVKPVPPSAGTCTRPELPRLPSAPTARDLHDQGLRARLREIECEIEARARLAPGGQQSCYFGPEFVRISNERYEEIRQAHKSDPVDLWHALLSEREDPNLPAIEIRVTSKSGPNCKSDRDRLLEDEANAMQKELNIR